MKKKMSYKTSYRVTFGPAKQHVGWINSDADVDLSKLVKGVSADHSDAMSDLLLGDIEAIDVDAPVKSFHIVGKATAQNPGEFLGYLDTVKPARAETILKLWDQMSFAPVVK